MTKNNAPQQRITFITAEIPIGISRLFVIFGLTRKSTTCFSVTKRYTNRWQQAGETSEHKLK